MPDWLSYAGAIGSIAGVIVSLVGFFITVFQVLRSKSIAEKSKEAAEQASAAAQSAVQRVGEQLTSNRVADALRLSNELRQFIRDGKWERAADRCQKLRLITVQLRRGNWMPEKERERLVHPIDDLKEIQRQTERFCDLEREVSAPRQLTETLDDLLDIFAGLNARFENSALELRDGD